MSFSLKVYSKSLTATVSRDVPELDSVDAARSTFGDELVLELARAGVKKWIRAWVTKQPKTSANDLQSALTSVNIADLAPTRTGGGGGTTRTLNNITAKVKDMTPEQREAFKAKLRAEGLI